MMHADCRARLFNDAAVALSQARLKLCVLHGSKDFPRDIGSDLDCVCDEPERIPLALHLSGAGVVVQSIAMGPRARYYVLFASCGQHLAFAALDVAADYRRDGALVFDRAELDHGRRSIGPVDVPAIDIEFSAYVIKRVLKGSIEPAHADRLAELFRTEPAACRARLDRFFAAADADLLARAAGGGDWDKVRAQMTGLRRRLRGRLRTRNPVERLVTWASELRRAVGRLRHPTGLHVTFVGPRSSQTGAILKRIAVDLSPVFWRAEFPEHWPAAADGQNPHPPPRAAFAARSPLRIASKAIHALSVYRRLVRSTLVLSYVEPAGLLEPNSSFSRRFHRFIIPPSLAIILAPDSSVPSASGERARSAPPPVRGASVARRSRGLRAVDASRSIEEIAFDVESIIIGHMAARTARRLGVAMRMDAVTAGDMTPAP